MINMDLELISYTNNKYTFKIKSYLGWCFKGNCTCKTDSSKKENCKNYQSKRISIKIN